MTFGGSNGVAAEDQAINKMIEPNHQANKI